MQWTWLLLLFGLVLWGISSVSALYFNMPFFPNREKIMTTPRKEKKREARREEKAEMAAVLEKVGWVHLYNHRGASASIAPKIPN